MKQEHMSSTTFTPLLRSESIIRCSAGRGYQGEVEFKGERKERRKGEKEKIENKSEK
jgi:hypothetical protein